MSATSDQSLRSQYHPTRILLFCGKRKSGKDFLTDQLQDMLQSDQTTASPKSSVIIRLSGPLKKCYADDHGLDYEELMGAGEYKERHRIDMIQWSEALRNKDSGYFCRAALQMYEAEKHSVWIVSDCRRKTDFRFFEKLFPGDGGGNGVVCRRVRVFASEETRAKRGFVFQAGVDDAESECGLDDVEEFHHDIENDGERTAKELLAPVIEDLMK